MSDDPLRIVVSTEEAGRVDKVVAARFPDAGRRLLARMFREGAIRLDGKRVKKGAFAAAGSVVELSEAPPTAEDLRVAADPSLDIHVLWSDDDLVALAKPAGIPSHPLRAGELGTVANGLVARFPECAAVGDDPREAGLAHRLDGGTSGVLVAARSQAMWTATRQLFGDGRVTKIYLALVCAPIGRGSCMEPLAPRGKRSVISHEVDALPADTEWTVRERIGDFTLLECRANTGRMHQIRAHLAHSGAPIVGDELYGGPAAGNLPLIGHFLHAASIELPHPRSGELLHIEAPLADDRAATLEALR
jgi:23S rRNA pseudouridine1911/1915/1917 synthase